MSFISGLCKSLKANPGPTRFVIPWLPTHAEPSTEGSPQTEHFRGSYSLLRAIRFGLSSPSGARETKSHIDLNNISHVGDDLWPMACPAAHEHNSFQGSYKHHESPNPMAMDTYKLESDLRECKPFTNR